jgi:hypothetical protein
LRRAEDHRDYAIYLIDDVLRAVGPDCPHCKVICRGLWAEVMDHRLKSRTKDVFGSVSTHGAKTDETDSHDASPVF